jgi:glycosyltransferase involved in cell wall biosynthesis
MKKISVVIPCRNEVEYIEECLDAIYKCILPDGVSINVYVVDGMSNDGTREKILEYSKQQPSLHITNNIKQLTPFAFNLGIYETECDFVQIIGARHIVSSNYISNCYNKLISDMSIWCVGGKLINKYTTKKSEIIAKAMGTAFGMGLGNFRILEQSGYTDTVTSPMYPYSVFENIGFFDENLIRNQDDDFNFRITKAGGKIYFDADISLKYYVRGNFKGLWRQFFQYGYWKVFVNRKHTSVTTVRQLAPPLFVVFIILSPISFFLPSVIEWLTLFAYSCYFTLLIFFSLKQASTLKQFFLIAYTFLILHFSYGIGYLKGILDFLIVKKSPSEKQTRLSR